MEATEPKISGRIDADYVKEFQSSIAQYQAVLDDCNTTLIFNCYNTIHRQQEESRNARSNLDT